LICARIITKVPVAVPALEVLSNTGGITHSLRLSGL
jgi:hypothetical protein